MNYSSGSNKTHGQIERADRIDSFEAGKVEDHGFVFASSGIPLDCDRCDLDGRELVELSYPGSQWQDTLELVRVRSGYGGSRTFWLCPICGQRARYLYFKGQGFLCRKCAKFNYRIQQRTQDSINYFRDGMQQAREKLDWEPPFPVVPVGFPHIVPERPRYMHETTYQRHLAQFRQYQEAYKRESLREMLEILRR